MSAAPGVSAAPQGSAHIQAAAIPRSLVASRTKSVAPRMGTIVPQRATRYLPGTRKGASLKFAELSPRARGILAQYRREHGCPHEYEALLRQFDVVVARRAFLRLVATAVLLIAAVVWWILRRKW